MEVARILRHTAFAAILLWTANSSFAVAGEVLDRVALSIDNDAITESQILQQIRLAAFQSRTKPSFTTADKRHAAEQLRDRLLIEREMQQNRYTPPDAAAVEKLLKQFQADHSLSGAAYAQELAQYGLTDAQFRQFLMAQAMTIQFIDVRFRPAVQISEAGVREYYEQQYVPEWRKRSQDPPPPLAQVHDDIEAVITRERANQNLDNWLGEVHRQADIRWQKEVFP